MADDPTDERTESNPDGEGRSRDVVVPIRLYKTVTVFSTVFAIACVVGGFLLIDEATERATLQASEIDPVVAVAGIGLIGVGATTYAFSTRFRTAGMGKSKDDSDEPSDDG